jgi:hypothetical protein
MTGELVTALVQLHGGLRDLRLPLDLPRSAEDRAVLAEMVDQLEDYVIPRVLSSDAPLLAVVGGSTGAGKSTLVNSLVGRRVTEPGLLRPTTRSPVLVHNPADADWFRQDQVLPDLERVDRPTNDPGALQLVAADAVPAGLAIVDAPDIDSVEAQNRTLAGQLLAAADLWLFVTSAARYADQVPWDFLRRAAERAEASWQTMAPGQVLLADAGEDLGRASRDFRRRAERAVRDWQQDVLEMVRTEGADKRGTARFLAYGVNGLGVALMIVVFVHTGGALVGAEAGVAGGAAVIGQKLLEAVFGDQAVRTLAERARRELGRRTEELLGAECRRYTDLLDSLQVDAEAPDRLRTVARKVDDLRAGGLQVTR